MDQKDESRRRDSKSSRLRWICRQAHGASRAKTGRAKPLRRRRGKLHEIPRPYDGMRPRHPRPPQRPKKLVSTRKALQLGSSRFVAPLAQTERTRFTQPFAPVSKLGTYSMRQDFL